MASFTERIRLIFDVDSKGATTGFRGFANSVRDAEGLTGKMKAGVGSLADSLKANLAGAAVAAGAAIVAFGVKAVGAFTDGAKAALDASKATGLSVEQASRWIAVADDMGVSAEALTSGVGKIAKTLDSAKWEKYGIATRDASGRARAANDVLLDALDLLGRTTNETERARIGNDLFGKGYTTLAPLVGRTRAEYEKWLGAVEDGQVYTKEEAEKAEKFRLAMDNLQDALGEVTLAFGEAIAGLAPLLDLIAKGLGPVADLTGAIGEMIDQVNTFDPTNAFGGDMFADLKQQVEEVRSGVRDMSGEVTGATTIWGQFANIAALANEELDKAKAKHDELTAAIERQSKASWDLYSAQLALISGQIDQSAATQSYLASLDTLSTATDDATTRVDEHVVALNGAKDAALRVARAAEDQAEQQAKLSGQTLSAKDAALEQIAALELLAGSLAPGSELRNFLDSTIRSLQATAMSGQEINNRLAAFARNGGKLAV